MIFDLPGNISQGSVAGRAGETDSTLSFKDTHQGFTELSWSAMIWTQRGFWANPTTAASKIPPPPMCCEPARGVRAPSPRYPWIQKVGIQTSAAAGAKTLHKDTRRQKERKQQKRGLCFGT